MSDHPLHHGATRGAFVVAVAAIVATTATNLVAHDFWIEPSAYRPKPGALIGLRLLVGAELVGDPVPRDLSAIERFVVANGSAETAVPGRDGGDPAGIIRADAPGLLVVGYHSHPRPIELTREKFDQYLGEEGLDAVQRLVSSRKTATAARELFSRCAKTLVLSGPASADRGDRALGLPLELVAEKSPYVAGVQQEVPIVLRYHGKPQPGALVVALSRREPSRKLTARSDRDGRVVFRFPVGGAWLVKSVHMIPAPPGSNVDWESFWASLSFEIAADGAHAGAR